VTKNHRGSITHESFGDEITDFDDESKGGAVNKIRSISSGNQEEAEEIAMPEFDHFRMPVGRELSASEKYLLELKDELYNIRKELAALNLSIKGMDQTKRFKMIAEVRVKETEVVAEINDIFKKDGQGDGSEMTKKEGNGRGCTLDPADPFMAKWDPVMVLFLAFTATVTPWEVAFAGGSFIGPLFVVNRIVDFGFIVDMCFRELRHASGRPEERVHERGGWGYLCVWRYS
jgi:hypothetical protein